MCGGRTNLCCLRVHTTEFLLSSRHSSLGSRVLDGIRMRLGWMLGGTDGWTEGWLLESEVSREEQSPTFERWAEEQRRRKRREKTWNRSSVVRCERRRFIPRHRKVKGRKKERKKDLNRAAGDPRHRPFLSSFEKSILDSFRGCSSFLLFLLFLLFFLVSFDFFLSILRFGSSAPPCFLSIIS